jgi:tripeptidyl-peptidase-2
MICIQAEGIPVSPYSVRKALENTTVPIGDSPEDKLSTGQGLMQVDKYNIFPVSVFKEILVNGNIIRFVIDFNQIINNRCYEYIQQSQNIPCVWYQINIKQSGKTSKFTFSPRHSSFSF